MPLMYAHDSFCIAKTKHSHVISADGGIQKCLSMVGRIDGRVSNLDEKKDSFQVLNLDKLFSQCNRDRCSLFPMCFGGCRFEAFIATKDFSGVSCKKELTEQINLKLMRLQLAENRGDLE